MQLYIHAHVLVLVVCLHACVNMCLTRSDGVFASLTYCTHVLQKGLAAHMHVLVEWIICMCTNPTRMYMFSTSIQITKHLDQFA